MISKLQRPVIYILVLLNVICFIKKFHKKKNTITVLIFSNVLAEFRSPAFDGSYLESELFRVAKNNHRGNWELVPGFLEFRDIVMFSWTILQPFYLSLRKVVIFS